MSIKITKLKECHLDELDDLGRRFRNTLGFLTKETIREYLSKDRVLGAISDSGQLVGYLMFADYSDRFRIAQLCVSVEMQGHGIARQLFDSLKKLATTQKVIKLRCRSDFENVHNMWPKLGFIALDEKPGRSEAGHLLTLWCYQLASDDELGLWKAETSDEVLDVSIDAQIFYDFNEPDSEKSLMSKGLLNDFLIDSLRIWITDEIFNEISRHDDSVQRAKSRDLAHGMPRLDCNQSLAVQYTEKLKKILPYNKASEKSDIHHLAKTAASKINVFVTRDDKLIQKSELIRSLVGITVKHPVNIISEIHELTEQQSYSPSRVSGLQLQWKRMKASECSELPLQSLQSSSETKGKFLEALKSKLSSPHTYQVETLRSCGDVVAIRIIERPSIERLVISFVRLAISAEQALYGNYLIADSLSIAVAENREIVEFLNSGISENINSMLLNMGFLQEEDTLIRFTFSKIIKHQEVLHSIDRLAPQLSETFSQMDSLEIEKQCAPLILDSEKSKPCFLVPIKPGYAMGLIDQSQSADDLFGGDASVLLRWENVYYRKKSRHKMLQAPARILWYVSGKIGGIIAVSHLNLIEIDTPKNLFREFRKFGILEWRDLYHFCGQDVSKEIMALKFSHTFTFRKPISLAEMRVVFKEDRIPESLQSPSKIPIPTFHKLFELGFPSSL